VSKRYYGLPSLTSLAVFEATARHLSLKQAASELNVTPGAVSHQIKALETEIGKPLFKRIHRGVELTQAGEELHFVLASSFAQMASSIDMISSGASEPTITIGATTAVAGLWLMPRMGRFLQAHPDVRLNHRVSDTPFDLARSDVDLVVRYGSGRRDGEHSVKLFSDTVVPVCSPEFAASHDVQSCDDLLAQPLLQLEGLDTGWMGWKEWFAECGVDAPRIRGPKFNNYTIALQAAEQGAGIALGWQRLIDRYLSAQRLVVLPGFSVTPQGAFYLSWSSKREPDSSLALVRDWLVQAV